MTTEQEAWYWIAVGMALATVAYAFVLSLH